MGYINDEDPEELIELDKVKNKYREVDRYRNWPIYQGVDGSLYIRSGGEYLVSSGPDDAKKEIDKHIKRWNKSR